VTYEQQHFLSLVYSHIELARDALHLGKVFDVESHLELAKGYLRASLRKVTSTTASRQKINRTFKSLQNKTKRGEHTNG